VLSDPDVNQTWRLSFRFDAEAFRAANANPVPGTNSYTFARTLFTGSRITAGSHTASIQVTDSAGAASNIVSVSYNVARPAGAGAGGKGVTLCGVVAGVVAIAAVAGVATFVVARRSRKEVEAEPLA
jgi:predicted MFS family arabinose efflux permease